MTNETTSIMIMTMMMMIMMMLFASSDAFPVMTPIYQANKATVTTTTAIRYALQMPEFVTAPFPKSTWYDVANPTARRIVYDDVSPNDFMFATIGNNWPEFKNEDDDTNADGDERTTTTAEGTIWARINPIRRARNLFFRQRRQQQE